MEHKRTAGPFASSAGFILAAVGLLLVMASVFLCATVIPAMVRGIVKICRMPLRGRQSNG